MESKHCLNCDAKLTKVQNFCSNCGQSVKTHRFKLASFFHEAFHAITHADKGLFHLLKELVIRPGLVAREYIGGKRKKYFNPFTFFLILMAMYVFVDTNVNSSETTSNKPLPTRISSIPDPEKRASSEIQYYRAMEARDFMSKHGNLVAMFAIPFFSFFFWLAYYRREYNYSEHLVANLLFVGFANLAFTVVVFPLQGLLKGTPWGVFAVFLGFLLQAFYFSLAYTGFMKLKGFWPVTKIALLSLLGIMLWSIVALSAIAIYAMRSIHFYEYFNFIGH